MPTSDIQRKRTRTVDKRQWRGVEDSYGTRTSENN